jgi:hypothetical protein
MDGWVDIKVVLRIAYNYQYLHVNNLETGQSVFIYIKHINLFAWFIFILF